MTAACPRLDAIAHVDYHGLDYVVTSGFNYWILPEEGSPRKVQTGTLPSLSRADAVVVKELFECTNPADDEHSIVFIEVSTYVPFCTFTALTNA